MDAIHKKSAERWQILEQNSKYVAQLHLILKIRKCFCDVTPSAPTLHHFFKPFHFTAGDQLVVPIGASHISLPLQEVQSREREEREQTNNMLGLTQVQKGSYVTLCMCRLTLVWTSSENSTMLLVC